MRRRCLIGITTGFLLAASASRGEVPTQITSYFGKGFGTLINAECSLVRLPSKDKKPVFVCVKFGIEPNEENIWKGIPIVFFRPEIEEKVLKLYQQNPKRKFSFVGFESFRGEGEPKVGSDKISGAKYLLPRAGWHIVRNFEVRDIEDGNGD